MSFNTNSQVPLITSTGEPLKQVLDFKYLGSRMESTDKDIKERKAQAWRAINSMKKIWTSGMARPLKARIFIATVEAILLYGCESWTLTTALTKSLDGCYTRMLRVIFNISWQQHITNEELYDDLPKITDKIATRRLRLAGHALRHPELPASSVLLWEPKHRRMSRGRPIKTMIDFLRADSGVTSTRGVGDADDGPGCVEGLLPCPTKVDRVSK